MVKDYIAVHIRMTEERKERALDCFLAERLHSPGIEVSNLSCTCVLSKVWMAWRIQEVSKNVIRE